MRVRIWNSILPLELKTKVKLNPLLPPANGPDDRIHGVVRLPIMRIDFAHYSRVEGHLACCRHDDVQLFFLIHKRANRQTHIMTVQRFVYDTYKVADIPARLVSSHVLVDLHARLSKSQDNPVQTG